jgi:hypothetical protein
MTLRTSTHRPIPNHARGPVTSAKTSPTSSGVQGDTFKAVLPPRKNLADLALAQLRPQKPLDTRTPADAVRDADLLLRGQSVGQPSSGTAQVLRDAANVNDGRDSTEQSTRHQAAQLQLKANQALEAAQLAKLNPTERQQYDAVKQRCLAANDPVAALALQKLLLSDKLPGAKDLRGEGTTLDHLAALSDPNTKLADGVVREALVTDLVQELATPSSINQGPRGTCAPTTLAIQLAMNDPAEYARLAAGLASPDGTVTLAGGQTLTREAGTAADDRTGRSTTQRLLGSALMELSNGDRDYDNATGEGAGATFSSLDVLYEALTGRSMGGRAVFTDEQRAQAMATIDTQLRAGATVPVGLTWDPGNHKVLVTGTETVDGQPFITYLNPWGREERMPRADFQQRIIDLNDDPRAQVVGTVLQGTDRVGEVVNAGLDVVKGVFERLDPMNLLADVRRAQLGSVTL